MKHYSIDEFGTGSDPELGGVLAETFLEVSGARCFWNYNNSLQ